MTQLPLPSMWPRRIILFGFGFPCMPREKTAQYSYFLGWVESSPIPIFFGSVVSVAKCYIGKTLKIKALPPHRAVPLVGITKQSQPISPRRLIGTLQYEEDCSSKLILPTPFTVLDLIKSKKALIQKSKNWENRSSKDENTRIKPKNAQSSENTHTHTHRT